VKEPKQCGKISALVLYVCHQLVQAFASINIQSASPEIRILTNDLHLASGSIFADYL